MNYIQQLNNQDCGFACLKMLLAKIYKKDNFLYLKQDLNHGPYTYKELQQIGKENGLEINGYKYDDIEQLIHEKPKDILISFRSQNGGRHMVILKKIFMNRFYITDPSLGNIVLSKSKFIKMWDMTSLKVESVGKYNNLPEKAYNISLNTKIILMILRIFGLISGILGVFYIDKDIPIYMPILCFGLSFLFEILYRFISISIMKKIDEKVLTSDKKCNDSSTLFISTFSLYKKYEVTLIPSLFFSIAISAFLIAVFVLNDVENFIPILSVLLLSFFDAFVINPLLKNKEREIEVFENETISKNDTNVCLNNFKEINNKSYNYGKLYIIKNMGIGTFILLVTILFMNIKGITDISFIVFYGFGYWYLHNNLCSILSFSEQFNAMRANKCLLMNIIKDKK